MIRPSHQFNYVLLNTFLITFPVKILLKNSEKFMGGVERYCHILSSPYLITGDNGLGKTFRLDACWYGLTKRT